MYHIGGCISVSEWIADVSRASMAVVGVRPELVQATEACSAVRTCARWPGGRLSSASSIVLELDSTEITCSPVGELESRSAADGHQTTHCLGLTATRSRSCIAAWHWPRRSTTCQARRSSGEPGPAVRRWPIRPSGAPSVGLERTF